MDILRGIKTISVVLVSFFATLFVFLFILKSGIGEISFHSYILHTLILSISSIIAFYGSYLYYKTYAEKRNVRDFLFALSFFTFGTSFFLHALSVSDFFLFSETIFDITEHYGLFLSAIFLFISIFFHKVDVPKVYAFKAEISFVIVLAFFGIFIFFVYISDLAAWFESLVDFFIVLTGVLFFIFLIARLYFTLKGASKERPFLLAGITVLIYSGIVPLFYEEWNILWWCFHLVFLVGFLLILVDFLRNSEFDTFRNAFKNATTVTKFTISFTSIFLIFLTFMFYINITMSGDVITKSILNDASEELHNSSWIFREVSEGVIKELEFTSGLAIFQSGSLSQSDIRVLQDDWSRVVSSSSIYIKIRYIDKDGNEIVSVNSDPSGVYVVPEQELQNKKERYYFSEAMKKKKGEVYVSDFDLDREGAKIDIPYKPTIRYAMPVFDKNGNRTGIIIASINGRYLMEEMAGGYKQHEGNIFLVNKEGFYIKNADPKKDWSSPENLNTGWNIKKDLSLGLASKIYSEESGSVLQENSLVAYNRMYPEEEDKSNFLILGVLIDKRTALADLVTLKERTLALGFFISLIVIMISYFFIRRLSSPIRELSYAAQKIINGEKNIRAQVTSRDEIGALAASFNKMVDDLMYANLTLEDKVAARTEDLNRKVVQVEHQISETKKFQQAVEATSEGVVIVNHAGIVMFVNKAWTKMTGHTLADMFGRNFDLFLGDKTPKNVLEKINKAVNLGKSLVADDIINEQKGKEYNLEISLSPVFSDANTVKFFVCIFMDVKQKKLIDKAKTEFVSLASHQLRTPLSIINWRTEMLLEGDAGKLSKKQMTYMEDIYKGSKRMVDLVNSLLSVSRLELGTIAVEPEPVSLEKICNDMLFELTPKIEQKKLNISKNFEKDLPLLNADPRLTTAIFQNILSNAAKYTQDGGSINIEIKKDKDDILIKVADNGYGIPKEQQEKIFSKLFRADNAREKVEEGTGLGLYIVKSILNSVGGKIWFESELDKGTTFYVSLSQKGMKKVEGTKSLAI